MDGLLVEAVQAVVHTFADLHKKELGGKGGGRVLFFSSRHALHQHRPAGNLCLPKKQFFCPLSKRLFVIARLWNQSAVKENEKYAAHKERELGNQ